GVLLRVGDALLRAGLLRLVAREQLEGLGVIGLRPLAVLVAGLGRRVATLALGLPDVLVGLGLGDLRARSGPRGGEQRATQGEARERGEAEQQGARKVELQHGGLTGWRWRDRTGRARRAHPGWLGRRARRARR